MIENNPIFRQGYQCAIDDFKMILDHAMVFDSKISAKDILENWEKIVTLIQKKLNNSPEN
jgi:hypothetical protein